MAYASQHEPQTILEIGSYKGGTLYGWAQIAAPDSTLISIDLPGGPNGGGCTPAEADAWREFLKPSQTLHLIRGDSHLDETLDEVLALLDGRTVDLLFIDGDHSYEGVKRDFEMYVPVVRSGGLIGFHDIVRPDRRQIDPGGPCDVYRFWAELPTATWPRLEEFVDTDGGQWGGIGILET